MAEKKGNALSGYVAWCDKLPLVVKILFALFLSPIIYGLYRIGKGGIGCGIIWIVVGLGGACLAGPLSHLIVIAYFVLGVVDLISIIVKGKPTVFVDLF